VEESSIDTTKNNIPTTEETNPKNVIVNTNTTDEMVICEETGLKYVMPSANKKAEARNQLEIDDETGLKTTIEKNKTRNSKTTNNSNEPSRILESKADNSLAKPVAAKSQKEHEGKNEAQNGTKSQKNKENNPT
jgi:hypothetical protein